MGHSPFLQALSRSMHLRGLSLRTEQTDLYWIKNYIRLHGLRHPSEMGGDEVVAYLGCLAAERHVAVNTQKIVLNSRV